jgi:hypothetical protein
MKLLEVLFAIIISLFGLGAQPAEQVNPEPTAVECGACGAHVTEWWYVRDMQDTEFVAVCHDCYEAVQEAER